MDQITHDLRLSNWKAVIERCQARQAGQTAKQWLTDNNIPKKQYYDWLRRVRKSLLVGGSPTDQIDGKRLPAAPYVGKRCKSCRNHTYCIGFLKSTYYE